MKKILALALALTFALPLVASAQTGQFIPFLRWANATGTQATTTSFFSTTASSTNLASTNFWFGGINGNSWDDFCTAITGGSGLCDGSDASGSGGGGLATSTDIVDTYVIYGTSADDVGNESAFTYNDATNFLQVEGQASTTDLQVTRNATTTYATTTNFHISSFFNFGGDVFDELVGDGLDLSSGDLIFDCSDVAGTGITCSGEDITASLGTSIDISAETNLTAGDNLTLNDDDLDLDTTLTNMTAATFSGLVTSGNFLATGSSTLQNFTGLMATTTHATTTSLYSTTASSTTLSVGTTFNFLGSVITNVSTWFTGLFDTNFNAKILDNLSQTSLADPGADQIVFWDDSDTAFEFLSTLTGLSISGNTLTVTDVTCTDCLNATEIEDIYLLDDGDVGTGVFDFGGATSLEVPNGTGPTMNAIGQIALDTTSNNWIGATTTSGHMVIASASTTLYAFSLASTSPDFVSGGVLELPRHHLPQAVKSIGCMVDGGTNKVLVLSDDGTNDMTSVTCTTTWQWFSITTNNTLTANEAVRFEVGASSGTPDYVIVRVVGWRTSD